ncbi:hypothetical protein Q31b_25130 [Novipirellula aureliae]|uniref:Uncharacterized protein n=1 Tax=Novipirellula aureliae TaxID=2527966 RepID=A0A5C6E3K5_9BACT|nr:hypothetical protein [Novipirellula aureliae]TWU43472.1 hypothetical protein Q31b_25130 [Novipirellula aureliae]
MLNAQHHPLEKKVSKVTDNIFTAVGLHGANMSMIVGDDGVIIVDTLSRPIPHGRAFQNRRACARPLTNVTIGD